ncbi:MAG: helix-turn-helix transcriptional regulator [Magnetococcales bacterium]|nr:helix-turn-helix transcriptional regulator [Magnetococcales bacterium]
MSGNDAESLEAPERLGDARTSTPTCEVPFVPKWELSSGQKCSHHAEVGPVPLPTDVGKETLRFHPLGEDSGVFDYWGLHHQPVKVTGKVISQQPYVCFRLLTRGKNAVRADGQERIIETPETYGVFFSPAGSGCTIENLHGEPNRILGPMLSQEHLRRMLEGQPLPAVVQRFLKGEDTSFMAHPRITLPIRQLIAEIQSPPYDGAMRALYIQGKIFELMAATLQDLSGERNSPRRTLGEDRRKALRARDILMNNLETPPRVDALARQVGLSQKRLNDVFRDLFGATVFQCLGQWRLEMARDLLMKSDLSIKQISYQMGYAHPNNFILAFSKRFKTPPGRFRKGLLPIMDSADGLG